MRFALSATPSPTTRECTRVNGDVVRWDTQSDEFSVVCARGYVHTYYIPNPAIHRRPTNALYFGAECRNNSPRRC